MATLSYPGYAAPEDDYEIGSLDRENDPYRNYPGGSPTFDERVPRPSSRVSINDYGNMDAAQRVGVNEIEYAGGTIGRRAPTGWQYDWRPEAYADALGAQDIAAQQSLAARRSGAVQGGYRVDEGDAAALGPRTSPAFGSSSGGGSRGAPQFDDPASRLIEDFAMDRVRQKTNPDPNSGTAQFEAYLRDLQQRLQTPGAFESYAPDLVNQLKAPVYSDQESSQLKARVYDDLEVNRQQTKERWLNEVSRRGFAPSSGPALEGLQRIEDQFNTMRTVADREFAVNAIGVREKRRFDIADVLMDLDQSQQGRETRRGVSHRDLASSEEGRLDSALPYVALPKQLSDNSFQQGLQLVGAGGNPANMLQSALSIYQTIANNNRMDERERQASLESIFEYIAGLDF